MIGEPKIVRRSKKSRWRTIFKNSIANVGRGSVSALVAIGVAPFLTRKMTPEAYGAWGLVLQLSAYTAYLDFGVQTAVGRFVAYADERHDRLHRDEVVTTSLALLVLSMLISAVVIALVTWQLPHFFPRMPAVLYHQVRVALVLVGGSLAIGLPASVFSGIFVGLQRNEVPAIIIGAGRMLSAILVVLIAWNGKSLIPMAIAVCLVNVGSYCIQYVLCMRSVRDLSFSIRFVSRKAVAELCRYCFSLSVWSFSILLISGLDVVLVGVFDFKAVAYYTVAATVVTFIVGLQNAIFSVLIPEAAILEARKQTGELGRLLVSTTRYGMLILLILGVPLLAATGPLLTLWVGPVYAQRTSTILQVLVVANMIRLSAVPYAMLLIGTGQQRLVTVSPLIEGFSNLVASVIAGILMGAVGIAIGTLIGSIVGVSCNFVYNLPRTTTIAVKRTSYLLGGHLRPVACFSPLFLYITIIAIFPRMAGMRKDELLCLAVILTLIGIWQFGLNVQERRSLVALAWNGITTEDAQKYANAS